MTSTSSQYASASGTGTGGRTERGDDAVLAAHVVRGGQHAVQRGAAHDQLATGGVAHVRGDVRLPAGDRFGGERRRGLRERGGGPARERLEVDPGRRVAHGYRPVKFGVRRSATAAMPSWKSAVSRRRCCSWFSRGRGAYPVGEVATHRLPDREQRERRRRRDLRRERVRGRSQLVGGDQPVGEADAQRLFATHVDRGVHELERVLLTDDGGQRGRDAEALVEAELGEVAGEAGLGRRDPEVGGERQAEATTHCGALHRGDDGLAVGEEARRLLVERGGGVEQVAALEVGAGAEVLALGAEDDGPALGFVVDAEHGVGQLGHHPDVEPVVRRAVDLDGRDVVGEIDGDGRISAHRRGHYYHARVALVEPLPPTSRIPDVAGVS